MGMGMGMGRGMGMGMGMGMGYKGLRGLIANHNDVLQRVVVGITVVDANRSQRESVTSNASTNRQRFHAAERTGLQDVVGISRG